MIRSEKDVGCPLEVLSQMEDALMHEGRMQICCVGVIAAGVSEYQYGRPVKTTEQHVYFDTPADVM